MTSRWSSLDPFLKLKVMDLVLALILITGLSITTLIISIFGPTPQLIASFAWVLAASFVVNGLMLLEVASCAEES